MLLFFAFGCGNKNEESKLAKSYKAFAKCMVEKTGLSTQQQHALPIWNKEDSIITNIGKHCTEKEKQNIIKFTSCVANKCDASAAPVAFERLMKECDVENITAELSEKCQKTIHLERN